MEQNVSELEVTVIILDEYFCGVNEVRDRFEIYDTIIVTQIKFTKEKFQ